MELRMRIVYLHASKFGNGLLVADEFKRIMAAKGVEVRVAHIRESRPKELEPADLYIFSSPGRMGRPIGAMRRFLKKVDLPAGTKYALLTTESAPKPDKRTCLLPSEDERRASGQRVRPVMHDILQAKGLHEVAEEVVFVTAVKGPLETGWEEKVAKFSVHLPTGV
jgi:hypothetical protein